MTLSSKQTPCIKEIKDDGWGTLWTGTAVPAACRTQR